MILNHFKLIPHRDETSVTVSAQLGTSTEWEKTEKAALCVLPVFHTRITRDSVCQPYEKLFMLLLTSHACTLPTVSLTSHSRRQQLPPSPLSPPCLSPSHMHQEEGTDNHLPSHHLSPSVFFSGPRQVLISHYFQNRLTNRFIIFL